MTPDTMRRPFFVAALILIAITVIVEAGAGAKLSSASQTLGSATTPGKGILALAFLDALLLVPIILTGLSMLIRKSVHGKIQGVVTFVFTLLLLLGDVYLLIKCFALLVLMVSLLLAPIFGTVAYMIAYAGFNTGAARITLGLCMACKLAFAVCLILAQQAFLQKKGLVLLVLFSLLCTFLVGFLHNFVPEFLVSITDDIGALIVGVITLIFGLIQLVESFFAALTALL